MNTKPMYTGQELADQDNMRAMFNDSLPCNPIPFLNSLLNQVRKHGTDAIKSDECTALLWVLNAQAFGQMSTIDMGAEWQRLNTAFSEDTYAKE
jgi:hypothetical protein